MNCLIHFEKLMDILSCLPTEYFILAKDGSVPSVLWTPVTQLDCSLCLGSTCDWIFMKGGMGHDVLSVSALPTDVFILYFILFSEYQNQVIFYKVLIQETSSIYSSKQIIILNFVLICLYLWGKKITVKAHVSGFPLREPFSKASLSHGGLCASWSGESIWLQEIFSS